MVGWHVDARRPGFSCQVAVFEAHLTVNCRCLWSHICHRFPRKSMARMCLNRILQLRMEPDFISVMHFQLYDSEFIPKRIEAQPIMYNVQYIWQVYTAISMVICYSSCRIYGYQLNEVYRAVQSYLVLERLSICIPLGCWTPAVLAAVIRVWLMQW